MAEPQPREVWASGLSYEAYVGRWSRLVSREFVHWLEIPADSRWLDVGCGTGALCQTILELAAPRSVRGIDRSDGFVAFAREHVVDARVRFEVGDAQALADAPGSYDAAVSGLVLNFVPAPERMIAEMVRVTSGTAAVYVWDYAGKMQFMRYFWDAAVDLDPAIRDLDQGMRFPICQPEPLTEILRSAGLSNVEVRPIDIPTVFADFDDYWTPFLGGQGSAPGYVKTLDDVRRAALREHLRSRLPFAADGSIHLIARAWAARGRR